LNKTQEEEEERLEHIPEYKQRSKIFEYLTDVNLQQIVRMCPKNVNEEKKIAKSPNLHPKDLEWLQTFQNLYGDTPKRKSLRIMPVKRLKMKP
jgi:hypothetical protein